MANFIMVQFGDNEEILMNPNCRQITFMEYLRQKCQYSKTAIIDLINEEGNLSMVHLANNDENVKTNFEDRMIYLPVLIEKGPDEHSVKKVKPLLNDWEKKFPQLEKKIKIMTGELKNRISPTQKVGLEISRGKGLDRKTSTGMGRPSVTAGRFSSAKLSTATSASKTLGPSKKSGKGKGKKK